MFLNKIRKIKIPCITSLSKTNFCSKTSPAKEEKPIHYKTHERSFVLNVFQGRIEPLEMFPFPDNLTNEEKETISMISDPITKFLKEVNNPGKNDDAAEVPKEVLDSLWEMGAFALQVPEKYGGIGMKNAQYARLVQIIGEHDLSLGIILGAHQSIGFKGILLNGTEEQKSKYLPRVSKNEYAAFCLTEPSAGSDANSIKTRAILNEEKTHYILNGSKIWISNGGIAEIMTVFAQTPIVDEKSGKTRDKVTAFIVERSFGGVTSGAPEKKMGIKSSNTSEVFYDNVKVPIENVLGEVGKGFKVSMNILNNGRFGMAGAMSGCMKFCLAKAVEFADSRKQFGAKLSTFQGIQEKIARMAMLQYATESMAFSIAGNMDAGSLNYHNEAAISKCFGSEAAWYVCDEAIQIMGGMGFMKETGLERVMRDLRIFRIFEGTNDILRLFVVLNGFKFVEVQLRELQHALKSPFSNLNVLTEEIFKRVKYKLGLKSSLNFQSHVHPDLSNAGQRMATAIEYFSLKTSSLLMHYRKDIIHQQSVINRLADAIFLIYAGSVVLSRATKSINEKLGSAEHEKLLAEIFCFQAFAQIKYNLKIVSSWKQQKSFLKMAKVCSNVCESGGVVQISPLGV